MDLDATAMTEIYGLHCEWNEVSPPCARTPRRVKRPRQTVNEACDLPLPQLILMGFSGRRRRSKIGERLAGTLHDLIEPAVLIAI